MTSLPQAKERTAADHAKCFARSVVDALAEEAALEAVTIDRARQTISVATLGKTDPQKLSERLASDFQRAQTEAPTLPCALLSGQGDCLTCELPLSLPQQWRVTISHEGDKTTIARVTCPTAPRFWRWRDIPFPKVVQRDVEFLEHAEHLEEWKAQLAA